MASKLLPNQPFLIDQASNKIVGLRNPDGTDCPITSQANQSIAYASTVTPDVSLYPIVNVGTLTGAITVANPSNLPPAGHEVVFNFTQDGTGGRAVSWGANYVFPTAAWSNTGNTAGKASTITFVVAQNGKLHAKGANVWA